MKARPSKPLEETEQIRTRVENGSPNQDPNHAAAMLEKTKELKGRVYERNWRVGLETLIHIPKFGGRDRFDFRSFFNDVFFFSNLIFNWFQMRFI